MEIRVPHKITYHIKEPASVSDVVASLLGTEHLLREMAPLLEECFPGLHVEKIQVSVAEISEGSLKEILFTALFISIQKDLEKDIPAAIEQLTGSDIPSGHETLVTLVFCLLLFYGADFIYSQVNKGAFSKRLRGQFSELTTELSRECGLSEEKIAYILESKYGKSRTRLIAHSVINFFSPSKRANNASIQIGEKRVLDTQTVADIPSDAQIEEADVAEIMQSFENVQIELHAQDLDRTKSGWAAVVPKVSSKRLKMEIAPPIKPQEIFAKKHIRGDITLVLQKKADGSYQPSMIHLMNIRK